MNDPDETSGEERPADETLREAASAQAGDRETSADKPGVEEEEKRPSATAETGFNWSPHAPVSELPPLEPS